MNTTDQKKWHQSSAEDVAQFLDVTLSTGLSVDEVLRRQQKHGPNRVTARRSTPAWLKFLKQFNQPLVYILLLAVGVTAFLGEWVDSSVIFGVVLINAVVGFLQEAKAEKAIEALAKMVATENAQQIIDRAVQVFGGEGVRSGNIVERLYREIRALRIYEGATEVQKLIIARETLKA